MIAGCFHCHVILDSQPMEKVEFFKNLLGDGKFDMLNARMRLSYPKPDKTALLIFYKIMLRRMNGHGEITDGSRQQGLETK